MNGDALPWTRDGVSDDAHWVVAGRFLDALTRRDFRALEACLEPAVHLRALLADDSLAVNGAASTAAAFRTWFGPFDVFEVQDASIGQLGSQVYLNWRIMRGDGCDRGSWHVIEQHMYARASERISTIDLLTAGF